MKKRGTSLIKNEISPKRNNNTSASCKSPKTDQEMNILSLENRSFKNVRFSQRVNILKFK